MRAGWRGWKGPEAIKLLLGKEADLFLGVFFAGEYWNPVPK